MLSSQSWVIVSFAPLKLRMRFIQDYFTPIHLHEAIGKLHLIQAASTAHVLEHGSAVATWFGLSSRVWCADDDLVDVFTTKLG